jgi:putative hydrolase of the HAD superfamily
MSSIRGVLFDLDNTLYENDETLEEWARNSAERLLTREQAGALVNAFSVNLSSVDISSSEAASLISHIVSLVPQLSIEAADFLEVMCRDWLFKMRLVPGASDLLDALDASEMPFGIVTNAPSFQLIKIAALGLNRRTKCLFVSELFGVEKPNSAIFQAAAEYIGVPSNQILFVGDSPHHDVAGAHNAGMKAAWLHRARSWPEELNGQEPDYEIDSLMEVAGIVIGY